MDEGAVKEDIALTNGWSSPKVLSDDVWEQLKVTYSRLWDDALAARSEEESEAAIEILATRAQEAHNGANISNGAKKVHGGGRPKGEPLFEAYKPNEEEEARMEAIRLYYEANLSRNEDVIAFWKSLPNSYPVSATDAGKILTNPLACILKPDEIKQAGVNPAVDFAVIVSQEYVFFTFAPDVGAIPCLQITAHIRSLNRQFTALQALEDRLLLASFFGRGDAHIIWAAEGVSIYLFFMKHPSVLTLFPVLEHSPELGTSIPSPIFRTSLVGQCLALAQKYANRFGLDERDLIIFLLTGYLRPPVIVQAIGREIPVYDVNGEELYGTAGPIHLSVMPHLSASKLATFYQSFEAELGLRKSKQVAKNLNLFAFATGFFCSYILKYGNRPTWETVRLEWESKAINENWVPATKDYSHFHTLYKSVRNALFPHMRLKNERQDAD